MEFDDPVYGRQEVEKEVLQELIDSRPVQRLKHIHQRGPMPFFSDRAETKARFVDPRVAEEGMRRVSELSEKVRQRIEEHRQEVENGYCVKIVD